MEGSSTFRDLELAGWQQRAHGWHALGSHISRQFIPRLLDEVRLAPGMRLLDVATGPGYGAGMGAERGAETVGIDFAGSMVALARELYPAVDFRQADAQGLPFDDGSFDAVICAHGLLHFPDPDQAIREAWRVLRAGGRYAVSVWAKLERQDIQRTVAEAVSQYGVPDVPLPPAPPMFRLADHEECRATLTGAGFSDVYVYELEGTWRAREPDDYLRLVMKSTVRAAMVLEHQPAAARARIEEFLRDWAAERIRSHGGRFNCPAVIASGRKAS